jgi:hypothetical protein
VVAGNQAGDGDVVQQAGEHDLFRVAGAARQSRALEQMVDRGLGEAAAKEVQQRGPLRHFRQTRILAHHHPAALAQRVEDPEFAVV